MQIYNYFVIHRHPLVIHRHPLSSFAGLTGESMQPGCNNKPIPLHQKIQTLWNTSIITRKKKATAV